MKQTYVTPDVLVHGTVQEITAHSADSTAADRIFNASAELEGPGQNGSLDYCSMFEGAEYSCPPF